MSHVTHCDDEYHIQTFNKGPRHSHICCSTLCSVCGVIVPKGDQFRILKHRWTMDSEEDWLCWRCWLWYESRGAKLPPLDYPGPVPELKLLRAIGVTRDDD
jgi:hypothetical protein